MTDSAAKPDAVSTVPKGMIPGGRGGWIRPAWTAETRPRSTGRPPGASPRAALLRSLARNPDADGIGAEAAQLGERIARAAQIALDPDASREQREEARESLEAGLRFLAEVEPNVKQVERTDTQQRIVLNLVPTPAVSAPQVPVIGPASDPNVPAVAEPT